MPTITFTFDILFERVIQEYKIILNDRSIINIDHLFQHICPVIENLLEK